MHAPTEPTAEQLQAAFERMRAPGWPATLQELSQAASRFGVVTAAAKAIARGERVASRDDEATSIRSVEYARPSPARAHVPTRRRDDQAVDFKSRAAGERETE